MILQIVFTSSEKVKGQNGLGSIHLNCSRVTTYTAHGQSEPYMEVLVENPHGVLSNMDEVIE